VLFQRRGAAHRRDRRKIAVASPILDRLRTELDELGFVARRLGVLLRAVGGEGGEHDMLTNARYSNRPVNRNSLSRKVTGGSGKSNGERPSSARPQRDASRTTETSSRRGREAPRIVGR